MEIGSTDAWVLRRAWLGVPEAVELGKLLFAAPICARVRIRIRTVVAKAKTSSKGKSPKKQRKGKRKVELEGSEGSKCGRNNQPPVGIEDGDEVGSS
jgi:hypothetical protein